MASLQGTDQAPASGFNHDEEGPDGNMMPSDTLGSARVAPSKMKDATKQFDIFKNWFKADATHSAVWRTEAEEDFAFRAGDQWTPEDRETLNSQSRPVIVFNRVLTVLKAIAGMEINGRHEIDFIPRNNSDTAVNEVLSAASKWMDDGCDGEDEQSAAFDDCATCGMGWTEERLDYEEVAAGKYIQEQVDPREMYWDRTARKRNLTDARRRSRKRKMPFGDALELFPGKTREQLDATWSNGTDGGQTATKTLEEKRVREENTTDESWDDNWEVTVIETQWIEKEVYWIIADVQNNTKEEVSHDEYKQFEARMKELNMPVHSVKMLRKKYMRVFLGSEILEIGDAPIANDFSWKCITGELNKKTGLFFGLVRVMRDPQMWANKWLSQSLHILNSTAKGGIIAEEDAFPDAADAEDNYARQDIITWVKKGAIGEKPKIMPKPGGVFPQGHIELMQFAVSSIKDVTGINLELLGLRDENQPGIVEVQRKQAGMTVLATLFDSLRRFRKQVGRSRLYFIQKYFSDGRLIRVVGPEGAKAIPLVKSKTLGDYDIVVDDAPTSPNQKEANWAIIQPMLVAFRDQLVQQPELFAAILEYSPLPTKLIDTIKQLADSASQDPEKQQQKKLAIAGAVAIINKDQSIAEMNNAKAGATQATAAYDIAMARNLLMKNDYEGLKMHLDSMSSRADAMKKTAEAAAIAHDTALKPQQQQADLEQQRAETLNTHADTLHKHARAAQAHADTMGAHVAAGVQALTPIPHEPPPVPVPQGQS